MARYISTRKVKPKTNLDFLEQETVSSSGISWAICKSAPRSRQITMPAPHHSVLTGRMPVSAPDMVKPRRVYEVNHLYPLKAPCSSSCSVALAVRIASCRLDSCSCIVARSLCSLSINVSSLQVSPCRSCAV